MRKLILIIVCLSCFILCLKGYQEMEALNNSRQRNQIHDQTIRRYESELKQLESLSSMPMLSFNQSYSRLEKHLRMMNRYKNLKGKLELPRLSKDGLLTGAMRDSNWLGIEQADLRINFTDLTGVDSYIDVLRFVEDLERRYPFRVLQIIQKDKELKVECQLYGGKE